jgi:CRP-like cAMP-binding protein
MHSIKETLDSVFPLEPDELESFIALTRRREYKAGEVVLAEGYTENYLNFIGKGAVRTFYPRNGKEHHINFGFAGQFCSSYTSFLNRTASKSVTVALEDTILQSLSFENLQVLYDKSKNGERLGRLSAEELYKEIELHEVSLMLETPEERFNHLLLNKKEWVRRIPQIYLASYLNITPETFSRLKRKMMQSELSA